MYYEDVFIELNKARVQYLVVGGIAVVLHGVLRLTADLDLMVGMEKENLLRFLGALKTLGYKPKVPVNPLDFANPEIRKEWIETKNMKVFSFIHPEADYKMIDVFVNEPISFADAYNKRQTLKARDIEVNVISFNGLIELKRLSARPQDLNDIEMLNELKERHERKQQ